MRNLSTLFISVALIGCTDPANTAVHDNTVEITPTTGVFSEAEEIFYQSRYNEMVKAFASGQGTTNYDTEISFGQDLRSSHLPRGEAKALSSHTIEQLVTYTRDYVSDSFIIFENGRIVEEQYWGGVTADSLMNAKSLAKPLGVIAMGRAIELGYVKNLDQPVSDFIIEWKGSDKDSISIRHVLDMRTGLLPQGYAPDASNVLNRAYLHPRHDEVIIHEYPLVNSPGSRYDYSNANSELVSIIIERATQISYQNWLTQQVLSPLGAPGGKIWLNREGGLAHSGCCLALTSETYLKLGVLILQNGKWNGNQFLSEDFVRQMLTSTPQNKFAGMGLYLGEHFKADRGAGNPDVKTFAPTLHSEPYIDKDIALFDGNGHQVIYIMPSRNIVVMRLGARSKNEISWDNAYIPNLIARELDVQ